MQEVGDQQQVINWSSRWAQELRKVVENNRRRGLRYQIANIRGEELHEVGDPPGELVDVPLRGDFPLCVAVRRPEASQAASPTSPRRRREARAAPSPSAVPVVDPSTVTRAAKLKSDFGKEDDLLPISSALAQDAPANLLLGGFRLDGICGPDPRHTLGQPPNAEDLISVTCRTCGSRFSCEEGRRVKAGEPPRSRRRREVAVEKATIPFTPNWPDEVSRWSEEDGILIRTRRNTQLPDQVQAADFPLSVKQQQVRSENQMPCGHTIPVWKYQGFLQLSDPRNSDTLVVLFETKEELFGMRPGQAALDETQNRKFQERLIGLFKELPEGQFHVLAMRRQGSGAGGGDVSGGWILEGTKVQWCDDV